MTTRPLPTLAAGLIKRLDTGWHHTATWARGPIPKQHLGPPRRDGSRPKMVELVDVDSVLLRLCHTDGRAAVALYIQDGTTPKGTPKWTLDLAVRGTLPDVPCRCEDSPHTGEHVPVTLTATDLAAFVSTPAVTLELELEIAA